MKTQIISEISKNYAKALFEATTGNSNDEKIMKQLKEIQEVFESSLDLTVVMSNSSISSNKKIEILDNIFSNKIDNNILNLLKILVEKNRFSELNSITYYYSELIEKQENKCTVEIISPIELNFENKTKVLFKLEHKLKSDIIPIWTVDKTLIAGLVFKIGDSVIDTSLKTKLENLRKTINRG